MIKELVAKDTECIEFLSNLSEKFTVQIRSAIFLDYSYIISFEALDQDLTQEFLVELTGNIDFKLNLTNLDVKLNVKNDSILLSNYQKQYEVFCTSPLADPYRLYLELYLFLKEHNVNHRMGQYLHFNGDFKDWTKRVVERAYRLIIAPDFVVHKVVELLEDQGIEFQVLPSKQDLAVEKPFLLNLNPESYVIADSIAISVLIKD